MPLPATARGGKHAAPGGFSPLRAASLPCALLGAAGAAFAGLAVMPASAADAPRVTAAQALAPVELPGPVLATKPNVVLGAALERGLEDATARERTQRASRSRSLTTPEPEAATVKALFVRPGDGRRTSGYGRRWGRLHAGVDLAAGTGSPIRAVAAGVVKSAGRESGYGNCVRIIHADGTETVYAHMSRIIASDGEKVAAGELIGKEGNTGQSTGPHLHFEVRINGTPVNPATWLRKRGVAI
jgi:murein DD-endopeptidase MepM/ murein hydrolase activator NlpD